MRRNIIPERIRPHLSRRRLLLVGLIVVFVGIGLYMVLTSKAAVNYPFPTSRDIYKWPFSKYAPQNMPIGKSATYSPANIRASQYQHVSADFDIIYFNPSAPLQDIVLNDNGWQQGSSRCNAEGGTLARVKIDPGFIIPDNGGPHGGTPNHSSALLDENNRVAEWQPLTHCSASSPFTAYARWDSDPRYELNGDATKGSHGGSGMSGAGLAIKLGELTPNNPPRHALGIQFYAAWEYTNSGNCFKWPAHACDNYAAGGYGGSNPNMKNGALLALKQGQSESLGLTSEPGKLLAWTLENYGAYIIDDSYWPNVQIPVEFSPNGDFTDQFRDTWGMEFEADIGANPWTSDIQKIIGALWTIDNNETNSRGGGGNPWQCYAPPFSNGTDAITVNPNGSVTEPANCGGTNPTVEPTVSPTVNPTTNPTISDYDANIDGQPLVGVGDLSILIANFSRTGMTRLQGDLDGNGTVNVLDLSRLIKHWGRAS